MVAIGEAYQLWLLDAWNAGQECSCGEPLPSCPFWSEVARRARVAGADFTAVREDVIHWSSPRSTLRLVRHGRPTPSSETVSVLSRLYSAVQDVSGASVVVDASKFPGFADLLANLPGFDVGMVHLVRDPKGVYASATRTKSREDLSGVRELRPKGRLITLLKWDVVNEVIEVRWGDTISYHRVPFSEFTVEPAEVMNRLADSWGLPRSDWVDADMCFSPVDDHLVGSNPDRADRTVLRVREDTEGLAKLPAWEKRLIEVATVPTRRLLRSNQ